MGTDGTNSPLPLIAPGAGAGAPGPVELLPARLSQGCIIDCQLLQGVGIITGKEHRSAQSDMLRANPKCLFLNRR